MDVLLGGLPRRETARVASRRFRVSMGRLAWMLAATCLVLSTLAGAAIGEDLTADDLFDPHRVLRVEIQVDPDDWDQLRRQTRSFETAFTGEAGESPFTYFDGTMTIDGMDFGDVEVRKKGFLGSLDETRPSLKVKIDKSLEPREIAKLKTLTLNNNKQDAGLVGQHLTYHLYRKAGLPAPRTTLARVIVNGEDLGIYTHVESINESFLSRQFESGKGALYEGTIADFFPGHVDRLEAKNKAAESRDRVKELSEVLGADGPVDLARLEKVLDLDNFLKYWALESLINFWDGYNGNQNNYFVYVDPKDDRLQFIPWGADMTMTRGGIGWLFGGGPQAVKANALLPNRLFRDESIQKRYREVLQKLLDEVWNEEELLAELDKRIEPVREHIHANQAPLDRGIHALRDFINNRRADVEAELQGWPLEVPDAPRKPMYVKELGTIEGSFAAKWSDRSPSSPLEQGSATLRVVMEGETWEFTQWGASAEPASGGFGGPPGGPGGPGSGGRRGRGRGGPPPGGPPPADVLRPVAPEDGARPDGPPEDSPGSGGSQQRRGGGIWPFGQPAADRPPSLVLVGKRDNDQVVTLTLTVPPESFKASEEAIEIRGTLADGMPRSFGGFQSMRWVNGTMRLKKAERRDGAEVEGDVDLNVTIMRGGLMGGR